MVSVSKACFSICLNKPSAFAALAPLYPVPAPPPAATSSMTPTAPPDIAPRGDSPLTHIILDEVHERGIDTDLICLVIKLALARGVAARSRAVAGAGLNHVRAVELRVREALMRLAARGCMAALVVMSR